MKMKIMISDIMTFSQIIATPFFFKFYMELHH